MVRIAQSGATASDGGGDGAHRLVLSQHSGAQPVFQLPLLGALAFRELRAGLFQLRAGGFLVPDFPPGPPLIPHEEQDDQRGDRIMSVNE